MKGVVLCKGESAYTYMQGVFDGIGNAQLTYNWLVTEVECNHEMPIFDGEYCWLSGKELTELVAADNFQWIWGVLSGFAPDVPLEEVLKHPLPYADENRNFWLDDIALQNPLAEVEIVAFDASLTLFISRKDALVDGFMEAFPFAYDLQGDNRKTNAQVRRIRKVMESLPLDTLAALRDNKTEYVVLHALFRDQEEEPTDEAILQEALKHLPREEI